MAIGDVLSGDQVKIWIEDVDAIHSDLTNEYQAEVTNFNVEGGDIDYESIPVFGGFIDSRKPQEQYTISMDVILRYGTNIKQWDDLNGVLTAKTIVIQATDGTNYYWNAFNNCRVVNLNKEFEADAEWRGTLTFKLSAKDADGNKNTKVGSTGAADAVSGGVAAWS